jgi:hypothetical protein
MLKAEGYQPLEVAEGAPPAGPAGGPAPCRAPCRARRLRCLAAAAAVAGLLLLAAGPRCAEMMRAHMRVRGGEGHGEAMMMHGGHHHGGMVHGHEGDEMAHHHDHEGGMQMIPSDCVSWFDGCNRCTAKDGALIVCTLMYCSEPGEAKCLESAAMDHVVEAEDKAEAEGEAAGEAAVSSSSSKSSSSSSSQVPEGCTTWFDGCVACGVQADGGLACPRMFCPPSMRKEPKCLAFAAEPVQAQAEAAAASAPAERAGPPAGCKVWFDGCNNCQVTARGLACTRMFCPTRQEPKCIKWE